jgi:hypothetical protein
MHGHQRDTAATVKSPESPISQEDYERLMEKLNTQDEQLRVHAELQHQTQQQLLSVQSERDNEQREREKAELEQQAIHNYYQEKLERAKQVSREAQSGSPRLSEVEEVDTLGIRRGKHRHRCSPIDDPNKESISDILKQLVMMLSANSTPGPSAPHVNPGPQAVVQHCTLPPPGSPLAPVTFTADDPTSVVAFFLILDDLYLQCSIRDDATKCNRMLDYLSPDLHDFGRLCNNSNRFDWDVVKFKMKDHFGDREDLTYTVASIRKMCKESAQEDLIMFSSVQHHAAKFCVAINYLTQKGKIRNEEGDRIFWSSVLKRHMSDVHLALKLSHLTHSFHMKPYPWAAVSKALCDIVQGAWWDTKEKADSRMWLEKYVPQSNLTTDASFTELMAKLRQFDHTTPEYNNLFT